MEYPAVYGQTSQPEKRIEVEGAHGELLARGGLCARLYQRQFREDADGVVVADAVQPKLSRYPSGRASDGGPFSTSTSELLRAADSPYLQLTHPPSMVIEAPVVRNTGSTPPQLHGLAQKGPLGVALKALMLGGARHNLDIPLRAHAMLSTNMEVQMHALTLAVPAILGLALTACESQPPSAPQGASNDHSAPVPGLPLGSANANCRYTINPPGNGPPTTQVNIPVGGTATFIPTNIPDCDGAWGFLTPTDGRLEFNNSGSPCTDFAQEEGGPAHLLKLYRCVAGGGLLQIYTNSAKTTLLQNIQIDPIP